MANAKENAIKLSKQRNELLSHGYTSNSPDVKNIDKKIKAVRKNNETQKRRHRLKIQKQNPESLLEKTIKASKVPSDPTTGYGEIGVIIFKDNRDSIVIGLPDFGEKLTIDKSEKISYEALITDTVFKCAVNQVRENRNDWADTLSEKDALNVGLAKPISESDYKKHIPLDLPITDFDKKLSKIQPPAYCFVPINISDICEQAGRNIEPMEYKPLVKSYDDEISPRLTYEDVMNSNNDRALFNCELDRLMAIIPQNSQNNFVASLKS